MNKICKQCQGVFPLDSFHKDRREKDGHVIICKECAKEKSRIWNATNQERKKETCKIYYTKNSRIIIQKTSEHKKNNRDRINELARTSYAFNLEESRQKARERMQRWRSNPANKDSQREQRNVEVALHPGERARKLRLWRSNNPELAKAQTDRRRALRRGATQSTLTSKEWAFIKLSYDHRCAYCGKKQKRLTQDHITPLSRGGTHTIDNVVPACQSCNSRKHAGAPLCPVQPILPLGF